MTPPARPSDDLPTLGWQLRASLEALCDDADGPSARDFRRFLRFAVSRAWRAAATGQFGGVREVIDLMREARTVIDDALPRLSPRALAAVEVQQALATLYTGEDELREVELETRLSDAHRHPTERAVLEVLTSAERPLRQKEVLDRMPEDQRPSAARVGQILRELYDNGFTRRQLARARGRAEVAHYHLAPRGLALCQELGMVRQRQIAAMLHPVQPPHQVVLNPASFNSKDHERPRAIPAITPTSITALAQARQKDPYFKRIISGLFQSTRNQELGQHVLQKSMEAEAIIDKNSRGRFTFEKRDALASELSLAGSTQEVLAHEVYQMSL